jgi:hypothetical protein
MSSFIFTGVNRCLFWAFKVSVVIGFFAAQYELTLPHLSMGLRKLNLHEIGLALMNFLVVCILALITLYEVPDMFGWDRLK